MRLYHPVLPWYIEIQKTNSRGITIFDVLQQMHQQLMVPLTERDVWNEEVSEERRAALAQGCRRRAMRRADGSLIFSEYGAVRLDFLGHCYVFAGLTEGKNGMWEIKTRDWRV